MDISNSKEDKLNAMREALNKGGNDMQETIKDISISNIIFSGPCTIVMWADGTKTIVRCGENDVFDPEKGIAMALMRKVYGPRHHYMKELGPFIEEYYEKQRTKEELIRAVGGTGLNFKDAVNNMKTNLAGLFSGKAFTDKVKEAQDDENETDV